MTKRIAVFKQRLTQINGDKAVESVCHLTYELDSDETNPVFWVVFFEFVEGFIHAVGVALTEVFVDVLYLVFVHYLVQIIVDVKLGSTIDDGVKFFQEIFELHALRTGDVLQIYLTVYGLNDKNLVLAQVYVGVEFHR